MSDKPVAGIVTAVAITPLLAVCCLGPAYLASALGWVTGWFSGINPVTTTGLAIVGGIVVYGVLRRRRARAAACCDPPVDVAEIGPSRLRVHRDADPDAARSATSGGRRQPSSIRRAA